MSIFNIPKKSDTEEKEVKKEEKEEVKKEPDRSLLGDKLWVNASTAKWGWLKKRDNFAGIKGAEKFTDQKGKEKAWGDLTKDMGAILEKKELLKKLQNLKDEMRSKKGRASTIQGRKEIERDWNMIARAYGQDSLPIHLKSLY